MPGSYNIQNISNSPAILTIKSLSQPHVKNVTLQPGESVSDVIKGGVMQLIIENNNGHWWEGLVPCGNIAVDNRQVTSSGQLMVNLLKSASQSMTGYIIIGIVILLAVLITIWYFRRKR